MKYFLLAFFCFLNLAQASHCVIQSVRIVGDVDEKAEQFFGKLREENCEKGDEVLKEFVDELSENGFPFANASFEVDSLGNATVTLKRGNAFVWAAAENAENSRSKHETFAKLSGLTAGSLVRLSDLERAKRKLINSGYFESTAEPKLFRDSLRNKLVPVFFMRDLSVNSFEGMLSYASGDAGGWAGNIDLHLYNMRGTGRDLAVSGETGDFGHSLSASYKEPWLLGTDWNGIVRGSFEEDSSFRSAEIEAGVSRSIGFFFEFAVLGGVGNDRWINTLETQYKNEDRVILPRHGVTFHGIFRVTKDRKDSSHAFTTDLHADARLLTPIVSAFVLQTSAWAGTLLPTDRDFKYTELYELGGVSNLKGFRPGFFRTRAYGITEADLQWQAVENTAFHLFFEPALHRGLAPAHGWIRTFSYGIGISQYRGFWSFSLFYALSNGTDPLEGLLHFGVKALF